MSFIVSSEPTFAPKEPVPAGAQIAICTQLIFLGTVTEFNQFENKTETKPKLHFGFELCEVTHEYGGKTENRVITKRFNKSLHENSALRPFLENWRGGAFSTAELNAGWDITKVLGVPCMLTIQHGKKQGSDEISTKIAGIAPLHKSMTKPAQTLPTVVLDYTPEKWNWDTYEALPKYLKEIMAGTPEFKKMGQPEAGTPAATAQIQAKAATPVVADGDLPF